MATTSRESPGVLSELQRVAFGKWRESVDSSEMAKQTRLCKCECQGGMEEDGKNVGVALSVRDDGSVDVLMRSCDAYVVDGLEEIDLSTSLYEPQDLINVFEGDINGGESSEPRTIETELSLEGTSSAELERPQRLYLDFLELQRLKDERAAELKAASSASTATMQPSYDGDLSELQLASFAQQWSDKGEAIDATAVKDYVPSVQPTTGSFMDDPDTLLDLQVPLLQQVVL